MPHLACSDLPCDRAYAGCGPLAIAEIMRYYSYPSNYNWANMPYTHGNSDVSRLIRDINDADPRIVHDCYGTGMYGSDIPGVFKHFHYSYVKQVALNSFLEIEGEIIKKRPVLMTGIDSRHGIGHVWVCDGYKYNWFLLCDSLNYSPLECWSPLESWFLPSFHMNWGWRGDYNGWYKYYNPLSVRGYDFDGNKLRYFCIRK